MNPLLTTLLLSATLFSVTPASHAKGCLKGAAIGGVAGHVAGHHGLAGAAIGCAVGHHQAKVKAEQAKAANPPAVPVAPANPGVTANPGK